MPRAPSSPERTTRLGARRIGVPGASNLEVWLITDCDDTAMDEAACRALTAPERTRAGKFLDPQQARLWRRVRATLRLLLAERLEIEPLEVDFDYGTFGKPECAGVVFNVSHTESIGVIALQTHGKPMQLGIDIEAILRHPPEQNLVSRVLSPNEHRQWKTLSVERRCTAFTRAWTRKEAWLKAHGFGISFGLERVQVGFDPASAVFIDGACDEAATLLEISINCTSIISLCAVRQPWKRQSRFKYMRPPDTCAESGGRIICHH